MPQSSTTTHPGGAGPAQRQAEVQQDNPAQRQAAVQQSGLSQQRDPARQDNPVPRHDKIAPALRAAFPYTVPILAGFLLTGITCGVFATSVGLPWWAPTLMSIAVFAGSAEFVTASLIAGAASPLNAFVTIFIVNARHLFYGLSMLDRFRGDGRKRFYTIYAMCDETFSLNYATIPPEGVDRGWFMFFIALLNQIYWVAGCTLGGVAGGMLPLAQVKGISFAMTALFVVIFLDQWLKDQSHAGAIIGLVATAAALVVLGPGNFMMPALVLILLGVLAVRGRVEPAYFPAGSDGSALSGTAATESADNLSGENAEKKGGAAE